MHQPSSGPSVDVLYVDGSLELVAARYEDEDGDGDGNLARAAQSLDRAFDLIDALLALDRQDDAPERRPIDLSAVAEACWRTVDTADGPTVRADESRLRRLLENLFRNSVAHGSTDALTVTLGSGGTGLGLAIVEVSRQNTGGSVAVAEVGGGGARFDFRG
jgi:signal transduction histidine kinase